MTPAVPVAGDRWIRRRAGVSVARALGTPTRAGIYEHLQRLATGLTVRDIAATFELHPNVARTHLETLADAGLVVVGRRKHPGGGRPAKVYLARDDAPEADATGGAAGGMPGVALVIRLLAELSGSGHGPAPSRAHEIGTAEGRRAVGALARPRVDGLEDAAQTAVRALRAQAPGVRVVKAGRDWVDTAGMQGAFSVLREERPDLADALERGLLSGAMAAAGMAVTVAAAGMLPDGGHVWRARAAARSPSSSRAGVEPAAQVDARGQQRETGVVGAMRAITRLQPGEVLEVLAEGPGSPAAFARWADRAGHELLGVERATDATGQPAIRLLIRKGESSRDTATGPDARGRADARTHPRGLAAGGER